MNKNIFGEDFQEFIAALNKANVEYMLVGGYSVILHGYFRTTGDMDIWANPTVDNYQKLAKAFLIFGMPVFDMTEHKFLSAPDYDVFTFGRPPVSIEILTQVKGLTFMEALQNAQYFEIENQEQVRVLGRDDLIKAKKAVGRARDLDDIEHLEG